MSRKEETAFPVGFFDGMSTPPHHQGHHGSVSTLQSQQVDEFANKLHNLSFQRSVDERKSGPMESITRMKSQSSDNKDFLKNILCCFFCGTACSVLTMILMLAIPIASIVMGALYLDKCSVEKYIPIYHIVMGAFGIPKAIIQMAIMCCRRGTEQGEPDSSAVKCLRIVDGPLSCFLLAWFICGAVWIYRASNVYQSTDPSIVLTFCDQTFYSFAFWLMTTNFIILGVMLVLAVLFCCIAICCACCAKD